MPDEHPIDLDGEIELPLRALDLQVAHQHPGQGAAQQETDGNYAGGGRQYAQSEAQLPASSSR